MISTQLFCYVKQSGKIAALVLSWCNETASLPTTMVQTDMVPAVRSLAVDIQNNILIETLTHWFQQESTRVVQLGVYNLHWQPLDHARGFILPHSFPWLHSTPLQQNTSEQWWFSQG